MSEGLIDSFSLEGVLEQVGAGIPGASALEYVALAVERLMDAKYALLKASNDFGSAAFEVEDAFTEGDSRNYDRMLEIENIMERSPYYLYGEG